MERYYSSGKLLLTGEYLVLDGALSLAVPTKFGQHFNVEEINESKIVWQSLDVHQNIWFETEFDITNNEISQSTLNDNETSQRLQEIFKAVQQLNPIFFKNDKGYKITTALEFSKNWGLGTSSTLIHNISLWANVDPYRLLEKTFGGSGYDIACAQVGSTLTYQLSRNKDSRLIKPVVFNPVFKNHLYFVYLNEKQDSREEIKRYKKNTLNLTESISKVNQITKRIILCNSLDDFDKLIETHEQIISKIINQKPIKNRLFQDFNGSIKSLGAWGGDFILATSKTNPTDYFKSKGFDTILSFNNIVKSK